MLAARSHASQGKGSGFTEVAGAVGAESCPPGARDLTVAFVDETAGGASQEGILAMGYRETREVARIRQELRERLMSDQHEGAGEALARLRYLAEDAASAELKGEYERWKARFEILAASARNN